MLKCNSFILTKKETNMKSLEGYSLFHAAKEKAFLRKRKTLFQGCVNVILL